MEWHSKGVVKNFCVEMGCVRGVVFVSESSYETSLENLQNNLLPNMDEESQNGARGMG